MILISAHQFTDKITEFIVSLRGGAADSGLDSLTFAKVFSANYLFFKFAKVFRHQSFPLYGTMKISPSKLIRYTVLDCENLYI